MGYDVCVVGGLGHVGLPLGIMLARAGKKVVLYDINTKAIDTVSKGKMPFLETGAEEILKEVIDKNLFVSNDRGVITESHFVIIVIGTPVDEHLNPQFTIFKQFFDELSDCLRDGQHIILRSTVFPGTTEKIQEYLATIGKKVMVSFCPERIAEGKAVAELRALPQIVASFEKQAEEEAAGLFGVLTDDIIYLTPIEAELAKLFTNVWRYIQFSISNQFYQITAQHNLDFYKIYNAITRKYPRAESFPSAGFAAGPCLFKDTMQLAAFSNNSFFLGHAAMLINEGLPYFIVSTLKNRCLLKGKTAGILGMAFKANNDDKRESLSYKLKKIMEIEAKLVICSDVYINEPGFVTAEALVSASDIIVLGTPHKEYADLTIPRDKVVVDVWNFFGNGGLF
ncbi:nucleotide sugar dehydrogenase [Candidatus Magnetominusculus dajiuhuensis]|uniref:nucleotide sugar dehydrogenase n=1 Tax=Candidatus Magnetominusculus dajiuhuensis TaxID=3137712 RepID=UPI003B437255